MLEVIAYTDGACSGNPGCGGWGVVLQAMKQEQIIKERHLKGGEQTTTNNRMELMAAISAFECLKRPAKITIHTDSTYVKNGVTMWIHQWKRNNWRGAKKRKIKNVDLWKRLDAAQAQHSVTWKWIKGHAGHPGNERADLLARTGMEPFKTAKQ